MDPGEVADATLLTGHNYRVDVEVVAAGGAAEAPPWVAGAVEHEASRAVVVGALEALRVMRAALEGP